MFHHRAAIGAIKGLPVVPVSVPVRVRVQPATTTTRTIASSTRSSYTTATATPTTTTTSPSTTTKPLRVVIVGSGPAAHTAAIYAARARLRPRLYEGFMAGGVAPVSSYGRCCGCGC